MRFEQAFNQLGHFLKMHFGKVQKRSKVPPFLHFLPQIKSHFVSLCTILYLTGHKSTNKFPPANPPGLCRKTRYLSAGLCFSGRRFLHEI